MSVITDEVDQLYQTILNRAPDTAGFDFWTQQLSSGVTLQEVRNGFAYSAESTSNLVTLSDAANAGLSGPEIMSYEDQLAAGSSLAQVTTQLNDDHVGVLYQTILGRPVDPAGLAFWQNDLANGASTQDVQNGFAYSQETTNRLQALASSLSLPLTGAQIVGYETELAGGQSFDQMTADLHARNPIQPTTYRAPYVPFVSGIVAHQSVPAGDTVQPLAALDVGLLAVPSDGEASVSPTPFAPGTVVFSNLAGGTVDQYLNYDIHGAGPAIQGALNGLTLGLDPAGDTVSLRIVVDGIALYFDDVYTTLSAVPSEAQTGMNLIYSSGGADLLAGSPAPDVFVIAKGTGSFVTITGFDPAHDILQIDASLASSFAQVQSETGAVGPGAYLHLGAGNSICLVGVDPNSLTAADFRFA